MLTDRNISNILVIKTIRLYKNNIIKVKNNRNKSMSPKTKPIRKLKIFLFKALVKNGLAHETVHFAPPSSVRDFFQ